jgi:hypothetical protein
MHRWSNGRGLGRFESCEPHNNLHARRYLFHNTHGAAEISVCCSWEIDYITNYFHVLGLQALAHYLNAAEHATTTHPVDDIFCQHLVPLVTCLADYYCFNVFG